VTIVELLSRLREHNIKVSADNGELVVTGPKHSLTPELRAELTAKKSVILDLLAKKDVSMRPLSMRASTK
jgi:hypothetical protein